MGDKGFKLETMRLFVKLDDDGKYHEVEGLAEFGIKESCGSSRTSSPACLRRTCPASTESLRAPSPSGSASGGAMSRPVTAADELLERHPWLAYVVIAFMAFFMSLEGVSL